jgi:oleate hydratase
LELNEQGNACKRLVKQATGKDFLQELVFHLGFEDALDSFMSTVICIPAVLPSLLSPFLKRHRQDRPQVIPENSLNFGFIGQFVEVPDHLVFTAEHSVRCAEIAVYHFLCPNKQVPPMYTWTEGSKKFVQSAVSIFT